MRSSRRTIAVRSATVTLGSHTALAGVSVDFDPGSITALIGPNGSGKTTLLRLVAGLVRPVDGTVDGQAGTRFAFVQQHNESRTWIPLTGREVLRMARYDRTGAFGRFGSDDRDAVDASARRMEVESLLRRQFSDLSSGQQQRLIIAQALAREADVLLLDEPITGLDLASQQRILEVADEETEAGRTVILATHHLEEAARADAVCLLSGGATVAVGAPEEVLTARSLRRAYGGRVIAFGGATLLDDHGHDHEHNPE